VIVAAAVGGVIVIIAAGLVWTAARLIRAGDLDAHELADKVAIPDPV
jgi:hypothetical protein